MADYEPRRGTRGAVVAYSTADGSTREIRADDDGVVRATDDAGHVALSALDLPVARKALAETKADEAPAKKPLAPAKADEAPAKAGKED